MCIRIPSYADTTKNKRRNAFQWRMHSNVGNVAMEIQYFRAIFLILCCHRHSDCVNISWARGGDGLVAFTNFDWFLEQKKKCDTEILTKWNENERSERSQQTFHFWENTTSECATHNFWLQNSANLADAEPFWLWKIMIPWCDHGNKWNSIIPANGSVLRGKKRNRRQSN